MAATLTLISVASSLTGNPIEAEAMVVSARPVAASQVLVTADSAAPVTLVRDGYSATAPPPPPTMVAASRYTTINPPSAPYSGEAVIAYASQFVGVVPYGMGNSPTDSFSCDGFVQYVLAGFGVSMPRTANAQASRGVAISVADARAGDLVWWPGQHIGIYDGAGGMYDSPDWGRYVQHRTSIWGNPVYIRLV